MFGACQYRCARAVAHGAFAVVRVAAQVIDAHGGAGNIEGGKRTAAGLLEFLHDRDARATARKALFDSGGQSVGGFAHFSQCCIEHAQRGNAFVGGAVEIEAQRGLERSERHLVQAHGACERIFLQTVDIGFLAHDDARLRAAEQLVARERHQIAAARKRLAYGRFGVGRVQNGRQKGPRAQIFIYHHTVVRVGGSAACVLGAGDAHQIAGGHAFRKAHDAVIRGVHL